MATDSTTDSTAAVDQAAALAANDAIRGLALRALACADAAGVALIDLKVRSSDLNPRVVVWVPAGGTALERFARQAGDGQPPTFGSGTGYRAATAADGWVRAFEIVEDEQ